MHGDWKRREITSIIGLDILFNFRQQAISSRLSDPQIRIQFGIGVLNCRLSFLMINEVMREPATRLVLRYRDEFTANAETVHVNLFLKQGHDVVVKNGTGCPFFCTGHDWGGHEPPDLDVWLNRSKFNFKENSCGKNVICSLSSRLLPTCYSSSENLPYLSQARLRMHTLSFHRHLDIPTYSDWSTSEKKIPKELFRTRLICWILG